MESEKEEKCRRRVCVVGAGIAGLVTAKVLGDDGFDVIVFEKEPTIGGVWSAARAYPGLRANTPREAFAFSDFPYPTQTDDFPTSGQVRSYLQAYVDRFRLQSHLHLSTRVASISCSPRRDSSRFNVQTISGDNPTLQQTSSFDFVAVCNGVFSVPDIPSVDGHDRFVGEIFHSSGLVDPKALRGKNVVVVGAGKSALDCAAVAAQEGASCTLVIRSPHWMVPRYLPGRIRMDRLFVTRLTESFLPIYHRPTRFEALLHRRGAPLVRTFWKLQNYMIPRICGTPPEMIPLEVLPSGIEKSGVGDWFYRLLAEGRASVRHGRIVAFTGPNTLQIEPGGELPADVVILATGWRQDVSFLRPDLRKAVRRNGQFRLYRHILPPAEPHLGFVGYASSGTCPLISELSAHWLSQCFRGELGLPSVTEMEQEIDRVLAWTAEVFPERAAGYFIGLYIAHFADDLLRDMGLRTRRSGNIFSEYFGRFWAERYTGIAEERWRSRCR